VIKGELRLPFLIYKYIKYYKDYDMAIQSNLTCPMPTNINPLSPNGFQFSINKIPEVSYFCQEVNLPDIILGIADQASPFSDIKIPGEKLTYGELNIQFLIDAEMANYISIHNWLNGLGFPKDKRQYTQWMEDHKLFSESELQQNYSDATLSILNSNNNPFKTLRFVDVFPTSLSSLVFQSTSADVSYLIGNASFAYTYYEFV
jgi:hypothetical protein